MHRILLATLAIVAFAGCDSAGPVDFRALSQEPAALVGTWDLERQWSYWTGSRAESDPREAGYTETWTFRADGTAIHEIDSDDYTSTVEAAFEVIVETGRTPSLRVDGSSYVFGLDGDRLILRASDVGDAPEHVYRRRD